jgi:hypothetical protein
MTIDPTLASLDAEQEREQSVLDGLTADQPEGPTP